MNIPLDNFEHLIDANILKSGLAYFQGGRINNFSQISNGEYVAVVSGTKDYIVHLQVKSNAITMHNCDCPFVSGPVCMHIVAVIFYLQKDAIGFSQTSLNIPKKKKSNAVINQVQNLLKAISHKELIEFVAQNCTKDKKFKSYFLASFDHLNQNQSKQLYQKQIHSLLQAAKSRDGWIDWSGMKYVSKTAQPFVDNANRYLSEKKFEAVFFISTALLEEMTEAFQYADDSNGDLGYFIDEASSLLKVLSKEALPKKLKQEMLAYCLDAFKQSFFKGWGWHLGILYIGANLIDNEKDLDAILKCLDSAKGDYERESAQSKKLELLRKYKDPKEAEDFIKLHISNPDIRNQEIKIAFENKDFARAIELAQDGIQSDEKTKPGLAMDWYDWLLKIALSQNDNPAIIEYARFRLIDNFGGQLDYYQILKNTIEPEKWNAFLENIIEEITPKNKWNYTALVREIYIKEEWWDRLFLMLKQNLSMENISQNEEYLAKDYAPELVELYSERLIIYVEKYVGRNHYHTACTYLRRMKKLGGSQRVNELVELFRQQYPQRKALIDELTKV